MRITQWQENQEVLVALTKVLTLVSNPPNVRHQPQEGDRRDRYFDDWFDGGAVHAETGGSTFYLLDDGTRVEWNGWTPGLHLTIHLPSGRLIHVGQESSR